MPLHRSTLAVHAGRPHGRGAPLNPPLVLASSFHEHGYAREEGSPAWEPLEAAIGALEGGTCVAFASGMAAISAVIETLPPGARVVGPAAGYAWTRSLLAERAAGGPARARPAAAASGPAATDAAVLSAAARGRIELVAVDTADLDATLRAAAGADLLWLESPSNPLCRVAALDVLCASVPVAVDSTFATPLLQRPLELGARFSIHSATKFIGGHSDLLLGVVTARDPEDAARLRHVRAQYGATPGALESFLALRGLRTLPVRLERGQRSAATLASRLPSHPAVTAVHYPEPVAFMDGTGAMLAFATAADVCSRVSVFTHAKSLGGVESLIDERAPGLLRLSIGCEHVEDLWADLEQALA